VLSMGLGLVGGSSSARKLFTSSVARRRTCRASWVFSGSMLAGTGLRSGKRLAVNLSSGSSFLQVGVAEPCVEVDQLCRFAGTTFIGMQAVQ
jgi:hypothetical protein